ncbi:hypothetical protein CWE09_04255 [Aliidiomarina minuta]|uniref:Protoporphyrinogen IX oxidase n=1 Tax=Aliidiomarina minuta TaxID=880057 RepID=A0A432W797_9GAMM|nr:CopD family protein [Aliidiomarina minuta]RUO25945.1 hypothetical protein CWE09_04255 [Aliidiomarina minuta]
MIWLLSLHIMALSIWSAGALYVPAVLAGAGKEVNEFSRTPIGQDSIPRFVYTHIATPAALIAIIAGSLVFLVNNSIEFWLIAKLTLVAMLAAAHACMGLLIIRVERQQFKFVSALSWIFIVFLLIILTLIIWLVLAKPGVPEVLPWSL